MPLNVRRFSSSIFLVLFSLVSFAGAQTQQAVSQPSPIPANTTPIKAPTAGEIMRDRISKAKAFIAVRNYNAAIYELEMIRRETSDSSVHSVTNILLMNSYLEQGNYKKAQEFLGEFYKHFKAGNANASTYYSAVAGQVVKGARNQMERYRSLGLSVSDRSLPLEAVNDIEKMRETLELVITQTRETSVDKARSSVAMPLLEEATVARSSLGRDEYDSRRWREEGIDAREQVARSQSVVINATDGTTVQQNTVPQNMPPLTQLQVNKSTANAAPAIQQPQQNSGQLSDMQVAAKKPVDIPVAAPTDTASKTAEPVQALNRGPKESHPPQTTPQSNSSSGPLEVGSLLAYVTKQAPATYPQAARSMRATGIVKVEVVVDENGDVAEVQKASGHTLLQAAAKDAIKRWKFRPIVRDGQAVRVSGFVNFNFTL